MYFYSVFLQCILEIQGKWGVSYTPNSQPDGVVPIPLAARRVERACPIIYNTSIFSLVVLLSVFSLVFFEGVFSLVFLLSVFIVLLRGAHIRGVWRGENGVEACTIIKK